MHSYAPASLKSSAQGMSPPGEQADEARGLPLQANIGLSIAVIQWFSSFIFIHVIDSIIGI